LPELAVNIQCKVCPSLCHAIGLYYSIEVIEWHSVDYQKYIYLRPPA